MKLLTVVGWALICAGLASAVTLQNVSFTAETSNTTVTIGATAVDCDSVVVQDSAVLFYTCSIGDETVALLNYTIPNSSMSIYGTVNITIYDAVTGALITDNVTIVLTSDETGSTDYTATGGYFVTDLAPAVYNVKLSSVNYSQSTYAITAGLGVYHLDAYLQQNTSDVVMQFVDSIASTVTIAGAEITQQVLLDGSWHAVSVKQSDVTGRAMFGYLDSVAYRFIVSADGYTTKTFILDPVQYTSYTVKLVKSTSLDFEEDFQGVYVAYTPTTFTDGANQINITFNSPGGTFTAYNYTVAYPGGSVTGSGSNVVGETFVEDFNITGATFLDTVNVSITYDTSVGEPHSFTYQHLIVVAPGNTTIIANKDNTYGLGLLERLLIGTLIIIGVAGIITLAAGPLPGFVVGLLLIALWIKIGFWPWYAGGLSIIVGFALLAKRSS